jgi:hypothetical protein
VTGDTAAPPPQDCFGIKHATIHPETRDRVHLRMLRERRVADVVGDGIYDAATKIEDLNRLADSQP